MHPYAECYTECSGPNLTYPDWFCNSDLTHINKNTNVLLKNNDNDGKKVKKKILRNNYSNGLYSSQFNYKIAITKVAAHYKINSKLQK